MAHVIRLSFLSSSEGPVRGALREGAFSEVSPMRHMGLPCRALQARAVLSGSDEEIRRKAVFLRGQAQADPDQLLFMDASAGAPFGALDPFAECADWIYDQDRGRWSGLARGALGETIQAPLFAFWLAQALAAAASPRARAAPDFVQKRLPDGSKAPTAPWFGLDWDWRSCSEPRAALFEAACRMGAGSGHWAACAAELSHPALAAIYGAAAACAFERVGGSHAWLGSFLEARALDALGLGAEPAKGPARL